MPLPPHVLRFWRALDDLFGSVRPTAWGAVVTDARFPAIWDANYARVDAPDPHLTARAIDHELLPALAEVGATVAHVVSFHPELATDLLAELSTRGHRLSWDLVMGHTGPTGPVHDVEVVELAPSPELWHRVEDTMHLFGAGSDAAVAQLRRLEQEVLAPAGKRWFGVRGTDGRLESLAALLVLEGVGYVDNVATFPEARGRGLASALTARIVDEAYEGGADHVILFADPDDAAAVRMYERLGFRGVGRLASTKAPLPGAAHSTNL